MRHAPFAILTALTLAALLIASCENRTVIPTQTNLQMALTSSFLTQNAPPPAFQTVQFAPIDRNLSALPNWYYVVSLTFSGIYADTRKQADASISAEVYSNELVGERRVVLTTTGSNFGTGAGRSLEGVRLGNTFYAVDQNGVCSNVTNDPNRRRIAELTAGSLVGGIRQASYTLTRKDINRLAVWMYNFAPGQVDTPVLQMTQGGSTKIASGELWVAPSLNVVVEYGLTLDIEAVIVPIFQADRQLTGKLQASYRLVETSKPYNIAIPFGC